MSVRYRQAFRETICCCGTVGRVTTTRNHVAYSHIKPGKKPMCYHNGLLKTSFDSDRTPDHTSVINVSLVVDNNGFSVTYPQCKFGKGNMVSPNCSSVLPQSKEKDTDV